MFGKIKIIFVITLFISTLTNTYAYELVQNGVIVRFKDNQLTGVKSVLVKFYADDVVRVIASPEDSASVPFSLIVNRVELPNVEFKLKESTGVIQLNNKKTYNPDKCAQW